jgi:hypothetical protein
MLCTWIRWQLSNDLDRDTRRGWLVRRHLDRCARCQKFAASLHALDRALATTATVAPLPSRAAMPRRLGRTLGMFGATVALVATMIWASRPSLRPVRGAAAPVATFVAAHRTPAPKLSRAVAIWLDADPLQDELRALKADTLHGAAVAFQLADIHRRQ